MDCNAVHFTRYAFERLFARAVPPDSVVRILREGEVIGSYPDDLPYPSVLMLGFEPKDPLHIVVARDPKTGVCYVITVYRPDPELWNDDFRTRRKP